MDTKIERDSDQGVVMTVKVDVGDLLIKAAGRYLDIVFDGDPTLPEGTFVEIESPSGTGVKVGTWIDRGDGFWALRLTLADFLAPSSTPTDTGNLR